ncbi:hypothetical protein OAF42_00655 [Planctomicrobium sp.]|nr:hypothetical protein [Planctomicrobium sp.]MDA7527591.1 hypothetical protein [bacterium]MDB4732928.1 hypothetical protein [Planctomicrobium sp.]
MTKSVISLALLGLSDFENDPLLQSITLQPRFELSAAFSCCYQKLDDFAKQLKVVPMGSCRQLFGSQLVDGLIWNAEASDIRPEQFGLGKAAKHLLIRSELIHSLTLERLLNLNVQAGNSQTEILPELLHRWTPATLRLRELIATQLGPIKQIIVNQQSQSGMTSSLFQIVDWLRMIVSQRMCIVSAKGSNSIFLEFERSDHQAVSCEVHLTGTDDEEATGSVETKSKLHQFNLQCDAGEIQIHSASKLCWQTDSGWQEETLEHERTAEQVMLDLFGRRIAGGIVPVPDLMEVLRTRRILAAIEESRLAGKAIQVDETSLPVNDGEFCI